MSVGPQHVHMKFATENYLYGYDRRDGSPLVHSYHGWVKCEQGWRWQYAVRKHILRLREST